MIRHVIDNHNEPIPAVLEIPSKDHPYDASKDSILRRAKVEPFNLQYYSFVAHIFFSHRFYRECLVLRMQNKTNSRPSR